MQAYVVERISNEANINDLKLFPEGKIEETFKYASGLYEKLSGNYNETSGKLFRRYFYDCLENGLDFSFPFNGNVYDREMIFVGIRNM